MSRANCITIFEKWLKSNANRFNGHEPILVKHSKKSKGSIEAASYRFNGITEHIELWVQAPGGCVVAVNRRGDNIDLIYDVDVYPEKTKAGRYFCSMCIPKYRRHYKSLEQLFINEACEYLVKWANEKFIGSNRLVMVRMRGASWAKIFSPGALKLKVNKRDPDYSVYEVAKVLCSKSSKVNNDKKKS